ncbi:SURF1 family protein [Novosphingobium sp. G106]|uniref:SURF1 family protein n=1 Tax=Novosphingobium sp. G106 TaxID=2849500 RepID=UPI001C2DF151|nr:SURF1 family protein [Novosphingobium sp. G106]MBV1691153.1 SURF1 family protein [Novosphingobium sp. G106]
MRRLPLIPTLLVLAAVAIMIRLGFWQISRMHEKEALLARYAAAQTMSADVPFPQDAVAARNVLYRHARVDCRQVTGITVIAGRSAQGGSGMAHVADCLIDGGEKARVVLGWSRDPAPVEWRGGEVMGIVAPGPRLVADPPLQGLAPNARPDPADIPNNHWSYAIQWFLFAATALVIYGLAVRKRLAGEPPRR